jgi:hypothetical protein
VRETARPTCFNRYALPPNSDFSFNSKFQLVLYLQIPDFPLDPNPGFSFTSKSQLILDLQIPAFPLPMNPYFPCNSFSLLCARFSFHCFRLLHHLAEYSRLLSNFCFGTTAPDDFPSRLLRSYFLFLYLYSFCFLFVLLFLMILCYKAFGYQRGGLIVVKVPPPPMPLNPKH